VPARRRRVSFRGATVLTLVVALLSACAGALEAPQQRKEREAAQQRLARAQALFAERCKTAGVVIHRTFMDVEGIQLLKLRPELEFADWRYFDPMWEEAGLADELSGESFFKQFLMSEFRQKNEPEKRGRLGPPEFEPGPHLIPGMRGYRFVEHLDPRSGMRERISLPWDPSNPNWTRELKREPSPAAVPPRYALDLEYLLDPEDRNYWVAGSVMKIIDQETGEVIARRTSFVVDYGFGHASMGRLPWSHAASRRTQSCPEAISSETGMEIRAFADSTLIPKQGD